MITFYHEHAFDGGSTGQVFSINTLTSNASYPLTNLEDRSKNLYWKAGNSNTSGYIQIDLGTARACTSLILGGHNYSSTSYGIKLAYDDNDSNSFANISYSVGSAGAYNVYASGDATNWLETFTSKTKRYWRLYLQAMGAGTYQQIANIFLGTGFEHSHNWEMGDGLLGHVWGIQTGETTGGIRRRQKNHDERRVWEYTFDYIDETHRTNFLTFLRNVDGSYMPFFFTDENSSLYYTCLTNADHVFTHLQYQLYRIRVRLEEEL